MRIALAVICAVWWPAAAGAQVTVDHAALDQLAGIAPPPLPPEIASPPPPPKPRPAHRRVAPAVKPALARPLPLPPPAAPGAIPAAAAVPAPPEPAPVAPKPAAPPQPLRILFADGSADLPAGTQSRLAAFCAAKGTITVDAHAPADPADPSAPLRLSLARAMAVRGALQACGVADQDILVRADGAAPAADENATMLGMQKR